MSWKKNFSTGDAAEKSALASDIIGKSGSSGPHSDLGLPGEWDGHLQVEDADNGVIIKHTRRINKSAKAESSGKGAVSSPMSDYEHKDHVKVFSKSDKSGIAGHVLSIIHSPRRARGY